MYKEQEVMVAAPVREQNVFLIINRQMIPLDKRVIRIGRQLDNDIVFHEEFISRLHAEIHYEGGKYVLHNYSGTGETFVNSAPVDSCVLNSGDLISFCSIQAMFVNNNARLAAKATGTTQNLRPLRMR